VATALSAACSRAPRSTDIAPVASKQTIRDLPGWYLKPPTDRDYLFGAATAVSRDVQVAINKAQADGRNALAQQLEVKYGALNKRFTEEVGREGSQLLDQYTQAYKAVVSQTLYGTRAKQQALRTEGDVYRATVLMELPVGEASKKLPAAVAAGTVHTPLPRQRGLQGARRRSVALRGVEARAGAPAVEISERRITRLASLGAQHLSSLVGGATHHPLDAVRFDTRRNPFWECVAINVASPRLRRSTRVLQAI
jgi:hypothetical protein